MTAKGGHGEGKYFLRPGVVDSCCRGSNSMIVVTVEQKRSRVKQRDRRCGRLDLIDQDSFIHTKLRYGCAHYSEAGGRK